MAKGRTDSGAPEAWERMPGETAKAFDAFSTYLALGQDRTMELVRKKLGKPSGYTRQLETWSSKWAWTERATAYEDHLQDLRRETHEDAIMRMSERHAEELVELQEVLMAPVRELGRRIKARADGALFRNAKRAELGAYAKEGSRLMPNLVQAERLVRGASTSAPGAPEVPADRRRLEEELAGLEDGYEPPKDKGKAKR